MKLEIKVSLKNEDGSEVITPIAVDTNVPDFEDFHSQLPTGRCTAKQGSALGK